jgi:hypothetical protein
VEALMLKGVPRIIKKLEGTLKLHNQKEDLERNPFVLECLA